MCNNYFDEDHLGFTSIDSLYNLENRVQKKLIKKDFNLLDKKSVSSMDLSKAEESVYLCRYWNEVWIISIQENFYKSFFLIKEKHL